MNHLFKHPLSNYEQIGNWLEYLSKALEKRSLPITRRVENFTKFSTLGVDWLAIQVMIEGNSIRVRVTQADSGRTPLDWAQHERVLVSYDQLLPTLQRLNQRGSRVVNVSAA